MSAILTLVRDGVRRKGQVCAHSVLFFSLDAIRLCIHKSCGKQKDYEILKVHVA